MPAGRTLRWACRRSRPPGASPRAALLRPAARCDCHAKLVNCSTNWEILEHRFFCGPHFHQRVQRGEAVERELSNEQVSELIEQKLVAAEEALERDSKHARRQSWLQ